MLGAQAFLCHRWSVGSVLVGVRPHRVGARMFGHYGCRRYPVGLGGDLGIYSVSARTDDGTGVDKWHIVRLGTGHQVLEFVIGARLGNGCALSTGGVAPLRLPHRGGGTTAKPTSLISWARRNTPSFQDSFDYILAWVKPGLPSDSGSCSWIRPNIVPHRPVSRLVMGRWRDTSMKGDRTHSTRR